jgi:hypothetical protein
MSVHHHQGKKQKVTTREKGHFVGESETGTKQSFPEVPIKWTPLRGVG